MKSLNYLFLLVCVLQLAGCQNKEVPADLQEQLDSIAAVMVPQHGEALCDISMVMGEGGLLIAKGETNLPQAKEEIISLLNNSGFSYADSITLLPDPAVVDKPWGLVTVSVCNVRSTPSHAAEMATQILMGTPVKILDKKNGWMLVQTPESYLGWTGDGAVIEMSEDEFTGWKNSDRVIYLKNGGDITDGKGQTVSDAVFGVILRKISEKGNVYGVVLPDGREGTVMKNEAADLRSWADNTTPDPAKMIAFARSLVGSPYLWGGTSTKGIDCSGFTKTIYYTAGMILTRDASGQYRYGLERSLENCCDSLAPGDLLFFGRIRDGKKRITHTGMYIGDTEFIHSSGMVKINSLDSTRQNYGESYKKILLGARRVIGLEPGEGMKRVSEHSWYF